jgi:hypothetical protein
LSRGPSCRGSRLTRRSRLACRARRTGRAGGASWAAAACRIALGVGRASGRPPAGR